MKRAKLYIALLLFCFQSGAFSGPISEDEKQTEYEIVRYNYNGFIDTKTSAVNDTLARWTISGDLYTYHYPEFFYVQLQNVKTSVFNGPISDLTNVEEKPVPPEAQIIEQMFAVEINEDLSRTLYFKENEPQWSINMKKGLYNFIDITYEKPIEKDGKILPPVVPEEYVTEPLMFGNCNFHVVQDGLVVTKTMNNLNCTYVPTKHETNFQNGPGVTLNDMVDYKYSKVLTLGKKGKYYLPFSTVFKTSAAFKSSPSSPNTQIIEQEQSCEFLEMYVSVEKIDSSEFTVQTNLSYQVSDDSSGGRRVDNRTSTELAKDFLENYDEFLKRFDYSTPEDTSIRQDYVFNMFKILQRLEEDDFKDFEHEIFNRKDIYDLGYTYFSILPYVGSKATVQYVINYMKSERINGNIGFAHKIFATFPKYIKHPTDEMLVSMEPFLNHPTKFKSLKQAAILSFASTVGHSCNKISKKSKTKYVDMFHNDFLEKEDYEDRMIKLIGLVNMAKCIDYELMNSITTNTSESSHLRALAFAGFKDYMTLYPQVYETYWPIVQKKSEPFEIRVKALDLLLSAKLTEDQFNSIVSKYSESFNDPEEQQLANYVLSSLHSIKNTTGYSDFSGDFALAALKNNKIPMHPKGLASGHYRLAYTESALNFGSSFDVRLITDPKTNIFDSMQVSYNSFGNFIDYGTYTLYFKFHGFFEWPGIETILEKTKNISSVPELVNLLKENNFKIKSSVNDCHMDIVFFIDNVAVLSRHFNEFKPQDFEKIEAEFDYLVSISDYVSYPILEYVHLPSDFGTPIEINYYLQDISKHKIGESKDIRYRSSWSYQTWFDIYNPLADAYTSNYKYYVDEKNIFLNLTSVSIMPLSFKWFNEKDSYAQIWENMMGTMVEEKALKEYCPKCQTYSEVEAEISYWTTKPFDILGFKADITAESYEEKYGLDDIILEFIENSDLHQYNVDAYPYAGPILYFVDILNYKYWLRSELSRGSIRTTSITGNDTVTETECNLYLQIPSAKDFGTSTIYYTMFNSTVRNVEDNETLNSVNMTGMLNWDTDYQDFENKTIIHKNVKLLEFYLKYNAMHPEDSVKLCGYGDLYYPNRRSDILSLLPFESVTGETTFVFGKNVDDDEDCIPEYSYTFKEVYSSNNIEAELEKEDFKKAYEKCSADSKNLKFTAPTEECRKVSSRITEYDEYKLYLKSQEHNETHNETLFDMTEPLFKYSRADENTINLNILNIDEWLNTPGFFKFSDFELYYPEAIIADPAVYAYNKDKSGILPDSRSSCTITPSKIQQFSGKYIPNQRNKLLAFANCHNSPAIGLKTRTIDDKHIGFTYYSFDKVIEATVKDGKAHITLNGKQISESYWTEDLNLMIYFLADDVVYITGNHVEIYYNTEYIKSRTYAAYTTMLCGVCTQ